MTCHWSLCYGKGGLVVTVQKSSEIVLWRVKKPLGIPIWVKESRLIPSERLVITLLKHTSMPCFEGLLCKGFAQLFSPYF